MLGAQLAVEPLFDVEPACFDPPPAVMSAVLRLSPLGEHAYDIIDEQLFGSVVATAFSQRRKTLRNALKTMLAVSDLEAVDIGPGLRPEAVPIGHYVALANHLAGNR